MYLLVAALRTLANVGGIDILPVDIILLIDVLYTPDLVEAGSKVLRGLGLIVQIEPRKVLIIDMPFQLQYKLMESEDEVLTLSL